MESCLVYTTTNLITTTNITQLINHVFALSFSLFVELAYITKGSQISIVQYIYTVHSSIVVMFSLSIVGRNAPMYKCDLRIYTWSGCYVSDCPD